MEGKRRQVRLETNRTDWQSKRLGKLFYSGDVMLIHNILEVPLESVGACFEQP